jgi:uncharacterized protein YndB with AHSA1/START domain
MKQTVSDAVVFECDLPEPREKVWRALTQKELLAAWLLPNNIRPEVGAKFQLEPATNCEVLEAEPGRKLRWRQREPSDAIPSDYMVESFFSFELADLPGGGTRLRVVHDGFATVATVVRFPARVKATLACSTLACSLRKAA